MVKKTDSNKARIKRHQRVRNKISGTPARPRLSVYRSTNNIYVQLIDDERAVTLCASSTKSKDLKLKGKTKTEAAVAVGKDIAKKAKALKITSAVFDRGGYLYIGRVKAVADGAREGGLNI